MVAIFKKQKFVRIIFSVFEGAPFKHFKHTKTIFCKMFLIFFPTFIKKIPIQDLFHTNVHVIKKMKKFLTARSSNCSVSAKFLPMLVETPYSGGAINPKTYLYHELGSKFFFLSSLEYKLVYILVFKKISCKTSKS